MIDFTIDKVSQYVLDHVTCRVVLRVLFSPVRMIMVPPRHYCVVLNPVARDDDNKVLFDQSGQAKLRHADQEIRLTQDPFPLYPGEEIQQVRVVPLPVQSWS